jgi:hypothetical protein
LRKRLHCRDIEKHVPMSQRKVYNLKLAGVGQDPFDILRPSLHKVDSNILLKVTLSNIHGNLAIHKHLYATLIC